MVGQYWERSIEERRARHCNVLPMGSSRMGLRRHRALLFKRLADALEVPATLQRYPPNASHTSPDGGEVWGEG